MNLAEAVKAIVEATPQKPARQEATKNERQQQRPIQQQSVTSRVAAWLNS